MTDQRRNPESWEPESAAEEQNYADEDQIYVDERRRPARQDGVTWADEAAEARTADDLRAVAPRDRAGRPSTGDETL